jgi:transaldolase
VHLYVDSADLGELRQALENPSVYGVTTNPTLLKRAGLSHAELPGFVNEVLELGVKAVHVQVIHQDALQIVEDAKTSVAWGAPGRILPKIPATREGFKAAAQLSREGIPVTMTAVYRPEQALWARLVGACYAAPYLGRLEDIGQDGLGVITRMQAYLTQSYDDVSVTTRLLVASVRSRQKVLELLDLGVGALTVPTRLLEELLESEDTLAAERVFLADAEVL